LRLRAWSGEEGRFITEDPARDGGNWFAYVGNNPMRYVDPTGLRQTLAQVALTKVVGFAAGRGERVGNFIRAHTDVTVTRSVYQGKTLEGQPGTYYQDNLSVRVFGVELNNIQVQSTVDHPRYPASNTIPSGAEFDAEIGLSVPANIKSSAWINDTIRIKVDEKGDFWLHGPWQEGKRPYSGGCVSTQYEVDEREVLDILREDLGFENSETVDFVFASEEGSNDVENLTE
jgi:hypothetical protein